MRTSTLVVPILVGVAIAGAYVAGRYVGKHDTIKATHQIVHELDSSNTAEVLFMIGAVRERLREGRPADADAVLLKYAALKAPALLDCAEGRTCTQFASGLMPPKEQLQKVLEEARRLKETK
jgi:hypothetical protein